MKELIKSVTAFTLKAIILLTLLMFFFGLSYLVLVKPAFRQMVQQQTLSVEGTAKKYIKPDLALVQVGVIINKSSAVDLKKEADEALSKTQKDLEAMGILEEKIKSNYKITPKYDKDYQVITGYSTKVTLEVKTYDFDQVDAILESAQKNGLILVDNVSFVIEDQIKAKEQLREEAIAAAKAKAEKLAQETGISLGKVINISEGGYYPMYNDYLRTNTMLDGAYEMPAPYTNEESISTINPGETEIQFTVNLLYEIN